jgi:zinc transport system substrate-binding protein
MRRRTAAAVLAVAVIAAACGDDDGDESSNDAVAVSAGFYPLAWVTEQVGGDGVEVTDLTPGGVEPHDLELAPSDVDDLLDADLAIVIGDGFQPAVEDTAGQRDDATVVLVDELPRDQVEEGDPHVWLDPDLMAEVVGEVEQGLADVDPNHAARYRRNADTLRAELAALDESFRSGLTNCARDLVVTSHDAFGYLTARYDLREEGVAGIEPDAEPDARRLAELADLARDEGVTTVFTEELVAPDIAETLAREAGGLRTEVLSPLETLTDEQQDAGDDYISVMEANLTKLRSALGCP